MGTTAFYFRFYFKSRNLALLLQPYPHVFIIGSNNQYAARGLSVQSMLPHAVAGVYVASNGRQLAGKILDAGFCT